MTCVGSFDGILQQLAVSVREREASDFDVGQCSGWEVVQNSLLPGGKAWVGDLVRLVVAALELDGRRELLLVSLAVDAVALGVDPEREFQSLWLDLVGSVFESLA